MTKPRQISELDLDHRKLLIEIGKEQQHALDKALLTLSGGALGVSLVFLKDVIGAGPVQAPGVLPAAWLCFASSMVFVLLSGYCSNASIRHGIGQIDAGTSRTGRFGGSLSVLTSCLNVLAPCLFIAGVALITHFACVNLWTKEAFNGIKTTSISDKTDAAATAATSAEPTAAADPSSAAGAGHEGREQGVGAGGASAPSGAAAPRVSR